MAGLIDGDTGFRAKCLSEATGLPTIAYERPSTASQHKQMPFSVEGYLDNVEARSYELSRYLSAIGISELVITGNSAAGLEAIAQGVAFSKIGDIAVKGILSLEPVGMRDTQEDSDIGTSNRELWQYFKAEMKADKTDIDDPMYRSLPKIAGPEKSAIAKAEMNKNILKEFLAYRNVYCSDVCMRLLKELSTNYRNVPVKLVLGDRSKATTLALRHSITTMFSNTSVQTEFLPASHSFPDRNEVYVHELKKFMRLYSDELESVSR